MDNQHKKITGYSDLSQEEIDMMNEIKAHEKTTLALITRAKAIAMKRPDAIENPQESAAAVGNVMRWAGIGTTQLQLGFMALLRAVAQPK